MANGIQRQDLQDGPASRSASSTALPSTLSMTPAAQTASNATLPHQNEHSRPITRKLKHMFENQKYAIFNAVVVLHEVNNVPQLQGGFAAEWKFRGKRPKGRDSLELQGNAPIGPKIKPSLPNLRLANPSTSSISILTSSTSSSIPVPPTPRSLISHDSRRQRPPDKAFSLPPASLGENSTRPEKKRSDPTPLKQFITSSPKGGTLPPAESPLLIEEPEGLFDDISSREGDMDEANSKDSKSNEVSKQGSWGSKSSNSQENGGPQVNIRKPTSASPSIPFLPNQASRNNHLSVPFPRAVGTSHRLPAPVRSGTTPSYSGFLDPADPVDLHRPNMLRRSASVATANTSSSGTTDWPVEEQKRPITRRLRSSSGPGPSMLRSKDAYSISTHRKGETPIQPLRSHCCKWDFELQHILRFPLSKSPSSAANAPKGRQPSLTLGNGPMSDSGLELTILQYPARPQAQQTSSTPSPSLSGEGSSSNIAQSAVQSVTSGLSAVAGSNTKKKDVKQTRKERRLEKSPTKFGMIDIDLAPFAGKGRMTRRFLLKGSRTNATVKVTVELQWVGGEMDWVAPPMQEGHHVTGVGDLLADNHESIRGDLQLIKSPSGSSSGSTNALERTRTNLTAMTSSSYYSWRGNQSVQSLGLTRTQTSGTHYEPYEHYLQNESSIYTPPRETGSPRRCSSQSPDRQSNHNTPPPHPGGSSPDSFHPNVPQTSSPKPSPLIPSLQDFPHRIHQHHTHHLRRGRPARHSDMHDLPPETVIEAIFNPHPAAQAGPFTYVPDEYCDAEGEDDVVGRIVMDANDDAEESQPEKPAKKEGRRLGWIRGRGRQEKTRRTKGNVLSQRAASR
ncbi:hypothetical protein AYX14_00556 [Cryptococcus neoformans]|nr:hypothetical protein AYX14_00556 [Cryptococcus neoformans var. grubii]